MKKVGILAGREVTFPESIIKNINEKSGGTVTAESRGPGKGSTFTVELPLDLPRYEPGDHRKRAERVFVNSLNEANPLTQPVGGL